MPAKTMRARVAITALGNLLNPISLIVIAPVLASSLGVVGRGELAAATAPLVLCIAISTLGLPEAATYFTSSAGRLSRGSVALIVVALVILGCVSIAGIWMVAPALSGGRAELTQLIRIAILALVPALILALVRGIAAAHGMWATIALEKAIAGGFRLVAIVACAISVGLTPLNATVVMSTSYFVGAFAYLLVGYQSGTDTPRSTPGARPLLAYGSSFWLGSLSGVVLGRFDQMLLTPLAGPAALGIYVVAVNVSEIVLVFNTALRDVIFPAQSRDADPTRLATASRVSTIVTIVLSAGVCGLAPLVVPWLFGAEFGPAVPCIFVLSAAIVIGNPGSIAGAGLSARNRPGVRSAAMSVACIVNVGLIIVLTPPLGAMGAALATLAGNALAGALAVLAMKIFFGSRMRDYYLPTAADFALIASQVRALLASIQRKKS